MRKLILRCGLSPGDIVMLTAAVRDLHACHPGEFLTDIRTPFPELWWHNPHITAIPETDSDAERIDCFYPLIDRSNDAPYHCLHGFVDFLNRRLRLMIRPTQFRGDIHLSEQEKAWFSQVHEFTGDDTPFWIVASGGKYDVTVKWWDPARYQRVIDAFRGRIQFVQVGNSGDHHPRLDGVIDLRGKTDMRELVRLMYHAQGVLCPVTALMHLAAAVPTRPDRPRNRACVVIAGGREPAHWEAYPDHQFIHTNGALPCCVAGGCWKDRVRPLRDGDPRDRPGNRCSQVAGDLPKCLEMITSDEVIRRIGLYYEGGALEYMSSGESRAAERGIEASIQNDYDDEPLNIHNAGGACDGFLRTIGKYSDDYGGRGIVICGGGVRYFTNAWVCIRMLRRAGCRLPVQLWFLGDREMDRRMIRLLAPFGVECVDACRLQKRFPARRLCTWELKPYSILHSRFREILFLDADNVPVTDPEYLFETPQFQSTGAIFWPDYDYPRTKSTAAIWRSCGLRQPMEPEFESGQIAVDKKRCWAALNLAKWFNDHSDFYYQYIHGDKETFHLAFRKVKKSYCLVPVPIHPLDGTMCQHDFDGRRIFQHRNLNKWDLFRRNRTVNGFLFERECREYLAELRLNWDGIISDQAPTRNHTPPPSLRPRPRDPAFQRL